MKDSFFISYNSADEAWAELVARILKDEGHKVTFQKRDIIPGNNFVLEMHDALISNDKTIAILSQNYLDAIFTHTEWTAAFAQDPLGGQPKLIPVRVENIKPPGLFAPLSFIDLVGATDEGEARRRLLEGLAENAKPGPMPRFLSAGGAAPYLPRKLFGVPPPAPTFTGRARDIEELRKKIGKYQTVGVTGLGGVGKTQLAARYAQAFESEYEAVLWAGAESRARLVREFAELAGELGLGEAGAKNRNVAFEAVKGWLRGARNWLLVLDNVDGLEVLSELAEAGQRGHILFTTQRTDVGGYESVRLKGMSAEEGAFLLLRRAGLLEGDFAPGRVGSEVSEEQRAQASKIVKATDALPLALEQAGAYISGTRCGLDEYYNIFQGAKREALQYSGDSAVPGRASVFGTFQLSFRKLESADRGAADLLRLCAFMHPQAIPLDVITGTDADLGPNLEAARRRPEDVEAMMRNVMRYSLLRRDGRLLEMHRLVQAVLIESADDEARLLWLGRVARALERAFPPVEFANWPRCQSLMPHVETCAEHAESYRLKTEVLASLLDKGGAYLQERGALREAERMFERAYEVRREIAAAGDPSLAVSVRNLAGLYESQGELNRAAPLAEKALKMFRALPGARDAEVAEALKIAAWVYEGLGRYEEAVGCLGEALEIWKKKRDRLRAAECLNSLGKLHFALGDYAEAEPLYKSALQIRERRLAADDPLVAEVLNNLGLLHTYQERFDTAEEYLRRAIKIYGEPYKSKHPDFGRALNNLGLWYQSQREFAQAENLYNLAVQTSEQTVGADSSLVAQIHINLSDLYIERSEFDKAERLLQAALKVKKRVHGAGHAEVALCLNNLGKLRFRQGRPRQAEQFYLKAADIWRRTLGVGSRHPDVRTGLFNLYACYEAQGKPSEVAKLLKEVFAERKKLFGPGHPATAQAAADLESFHNFYAPPRRKN